METQEPRNEVAIDVADALLDTGVTVTIPAPGWLRLFGLRKIRLRLRRPVYAQLLRIARLYLEMQIDLERLEVGEAAVLLTEVSRNGVRASQLIALGLIRSATLSRLLHRPLAGYLRARTDAKTMAELAKMIVMLSGASHFTTIIRSIAHLQVTTPKLSQPPMGS